MVWVAFFSWWYGRGWRREADVVRRSVAKMADTFSIGLLFTSLFSPYRQISAGKVNGPLGVIIRAWFDRLISRFIGALVRSTMIIAGIIAIGATGVIGLLRLLAWPLLPLFPIVGAVVALTGWSP